jgi:hypothetical protein
MKSSESLPPVPLLVRQSRMRNRIVTFGAWAVLVLVMAAISFMATNALLHQTPSGFIHAKN